MISNDLVTKVRKAGLNEGKHHHEGKHVAAASSTYQSARSCLHTAARQWSQPREARSCARVAVRLYGDSMVLDTQPTN